MEQLKVICNIVFSVIVWCVIVGDKLTGPYIFSQHLTNDIYAGFLQNELPALLEKMSLQRQLYMYDQHDGVP
jgi:hypothetical protein